MEGATLAATERRADSGSLRALWPSLVALAVLAVTLVALAFADGGYFPGDHLTAGVVVFAALAFLIAVQLPRYTITGHALVGVGTLAAFAAWTGISSAWSPFPDEAIVDFRLALVYVGIVALAVVAAGSGRKAALLPWTALAVCVAVAGYGLAGRLLPGVVDLAPDPVNAGYRLNQPLGYWNAYGMTAALGALLAGGLAADPQARPWRRALGAGLAVPLLVALYLSFSRGAWAALLVGVVLLVALTPYRISAGLTLGLIGGAAGLAIARLQGYDVLTDGPALADGDPQDAGWQFLGQLGILTGAAAACQLALAQARSSPALKDLARRGRTGAIAIGSGVAVLVAVVGYAAAGDKVEGRSARALDSSSSWIDRQWDDFLQTTTFSAGAGNDRLTTTRGTRSDLYRVSLDGLAAHPLWGDGAGGWEFRWYQAREAQEDTKEPHSLWLGVLGELGLVGAALLLAFFVSLGWGAFKGLTKPGGLRRGETAAVAATVGAFALHAGVDWDWQMPAVTGIALLAGASLLPSGRGRRKRRRGPA